MVILLTGRNGFLGREIYEYFTASNKVCSIVRSLVVDKSEWHVCADLSQSSPEIPNQNFDLVIHAAGKAHMVPNKLKDKDDFYTENLNISKNLLSALDRIKVRPKQFVFISSVAVYGLDAGISVKENAELDAVDPYGKSKVESERLISQWCIANNVVLTILRLPLIAGVNPPGNLGDMIKAIQRGRFPLIDGGKAKRSMICVKDIPLFMDKAMAIGGIYHLTDGHDPSFKELANALKSSHNNLISIPMSFAKLLAFIGDIGSRLISKDLPFNSRKLKKMTTNLTFSNEKAIRNFEWNPTSVIKYFQKPD